MEGNEISFKAATIANQRSLEIPNATVAIDPYSLQNEFESSESNETHHAVFYKSDRKSLPNLPSLQVVPRSPSTNVHVDINENYRDDDSLPNHDKYMLNETSSTISSRSNFSNFSFPSKQSDSVPTPNRNEKPTKIHIESPFRTKRKDPKIPDVFTKMQSPNHNHHKFNFSKPNKLSYSWPKYEIQQGVNKTRKKDHTSHHLYETAVAKYRNY